jgi:hypothetical protein
MPATVPFAASSTEALRPMRAPPASALHMTMFS